MELAMAERVLVTGITGYIGQHVGSELLKAGFEVVGTMRSQRKAASARKALEGAGSDQRLTFVEVDLLKDKGWDEAMQGVSYVVHVASPYALKEPKDENEMIEPAVEGTRRVVEAAQRAGVKRMVLTSSAIAIQGGRGSGHFGPADWADTDGSIGAYGKSKALAERKAWDLVENSDMELAVIVPGGVFGPSLGAKPEGQNIDMITDMINGKMPMIPNLAMAMVDVRDVAKLHVAALTSEEAAGSRFIAASAEPVDLMTLASTLKDAGFSKVSTRRAPTPVLKAMSLFDRDVKGMVPLLGQIATFDNTETFDVLGWQPTPIKESITEMARSLAA